MALGRLNAIEAQLPMSWRQDVRRGKVKVVQDDMKK